MWKRADRIDQERWICTGLGRSSCHRKDSRTTWRVGISGSCSQWTPTAWWVSRCTLLLLKLPIFFQITDTALSGVSPSRLHSIVVDTASPQGIRAYIGDPGDGFMIVYNANNRHWWRANLAIPSGPRINYIPTYDMVMSMSRNEPKLYITSEETDKLFSLTLSEIRSFENPAAVFCDVSIEFSRNIYKTVV